MTFTSGAFWDWFQWMLAWWVAGACWKVWDIALDIREIRDHFRMVEREEARRRSQ